MTKFKWNSKDIIVYLTGPHGSLGIRQPNPQMSQDQGPMNTIATMATSNQLTGAIQSKAGMGGAQINQPGQPDMIGAQGAGGGAMPNASQGGGINAQMSVAQSISPGPSLGQMMVGNQGMVNPQNPNLNNNAMGNVMSKMGNSGMDPGQGLPVGQMNPPQIGPGQPVPGTTGTLPETGANQLNNRTVIWRGEISDYWILTKITVLNKMIVIVKLYIKKTASKLTLHHMGKFFINLLW